MLVGSDLIYLPYDPQFSIAGVQYARDSLHYTHNRMHLHPAERLRKIAAGIGFEMAVRRWLEGEGIPYERLGATAFTEPDKFDLALGGRRCDLKSFLLYNKAKITALHQDASWLLDAQALIPVEQFESARLEENDLYLFGFMTGLEARHSAETAQALQKNLPAFLVFIPPAADWVPTKTWQPLGEVALRLNGGDGITVEVGGQNQQREAIRERIHLGARQSIQLQQNYFSILYLALPRLPTGALSLQSHQHSLVVNPNEWANIWIYGQRVYLCGWMNKNDFRAASKILPKGSPVKQYTHTSTVNRALPISELRPLAELVTLAKRHIIKRQNSGLRST